MNSTRLMRRARALNVGVLAIEAALFGFELATGSPFMILPLAWIAVFIVIICRQTKKIRRLEYEARPRPDYAAIARMEREVYGEASEEAQVMFEHAKLQARIAAIERHVRAGQRSPLCPCGGTLPQHIRSPHYLPGYDAVGWHGPGVL